MHGRNNYNATGPGEEGQFINSSSHGGGVAMIAALEIEEDEEEQESLLQETGGETASMTAGPSSSRAAAHLTLRKAAAASRAARAVASAPQRVMGFLRDRVGHHFTSRGVAAILFLVLLVGLALRLDVMQEEKHYRPEEVLPKSPHRSSFWDDLPKSNVDGEEVTSIAEPNWRNDVGFYWHHPYASPYAHDLYGSLTDADRSSVKREYERRRNQYGGTYGLWVHPKTQDVEYPKLDTRKDVPLSGLKASAWQLNRQYQSEFLSEGLRLVQRVLHGIYEEYGYTDREAADERFRTTLVRNVTELPTAPRRGLSVAALTEPAWEVLVRKLCHAIVTHDTLFVVTVGGDPGSSTNFARTGPMQFHYILEPVLDMLGVRLITRNMGGLSPTIGALGGASIFGEADILVLYNAVALSAGEIELLQRQSILSGDRVPVILSASPGDYDGDQAYPLSEAWVGRIFSGRDVCPRTKARTLPDLPACQYLNCKNTEQNPTLCDKFEDVCWVNRTDYQPVDQDSSIRMREYVDSDSSGAPLNYRQHQWEGRKLSLLVLQALNETLHRWNGEITKGSMSIPDEMWHVNGQYRDLREAVRTHRNRAQDAKDLIVSPTACEELLRRVDPMICHMSMKALTEWTPTVNPSSTRLTSRVSNFEDPTRDTEELYLGFDLLPQTWRNLDPEVDVHMLATATNESIDQFRAQTVGAVVGTTAETDDLQGRPVGGSPRQLRKQRNPGPSGGAAAGSKWVLYNAPIGFCDGSSQATCNRHESNRCLLANQQFYKGGLLASGTSDWLSIAVPTVSEGVILLRFDWSMKARLTAATPGDVWSPGNRLSQLPDDFEFEYSVGSSSPVVTLNRKQFLEWGSVVTDDLVVYPVLMNPRMSYNASAVNEQIDVKFRVRTGKQFRVILTHVYYA